MKRFIACAALAASCVCATAAESFASLSNFRVTVNGAAITNLFSNEPFEGLTPDPTFEPNDTGRSGGWEDAGATLYWPDDNVLNFGTVANVPGSQAGAFSYTTTVAALLAPFTTVKITADAVVRGSAAAGEYAKGNAYIGFATFLNGVERPFFDGLLHEFMDGKTADETKSLELVYANGAMPIHFAYTMGADALSRAVAAPVPEPETYALMLAGLGAVAWVANRRKRAASPQA
jgi:hypothetical protein